MEQLSIFDFIEQEESNENDLKIGQWVDESYLGNEITFDEICNMVGQCIIIDMSTCSRKWYKVVQVERIVSFDGGKQLVYYDGTQGRGYIRDFYFNRESEINGCYDQKQRAYRIKNDDFSKYMAKPEVEDEKEKVKEET